MNDITPDPIDSVPPASPDRTITIVIEEPAPSIQEFCDGRQWAYARQSTLEEPMRMRIKLIDLPDINVLNRHQVLTELGVIDDGEFISSQNDVPALYYAYGNYEGEGSKIQLR